jgi:hypothetical protein
MLNQPIQKPNAHSAVYGPEKSLFADRIPLVRQKKTFGMKSPRKVTYCARTIIKGSGGDKTFSTMRGAGGNFTVIST